MDAQSTDVEPERRTRLRTGPDAEMDYLRAEMLETENRVVEDFNKIKEMLSPEKVANHMVSAIREVLNSRIKAIDLQKISDAGDKVKTNIKDHPVFSFLIGLGLLSGIATYRMLKNKDSTGVRGRIEHIVETSPEYVEQDREYVSEASVEELAIYPGLWSTYTKSTMPTSEGEKSEFEIEDPRFTAMGEEFQDYFEICMREDEGREENEQWEAAA
jgi:hypothetical protein